MVRAMRAGMPVEQLAEVEFAYPTPSHPLWGSRLAKSAANWASWSSRRRGVPERTAGAEW